MKNNSFSKVLILLAVVIVIVLAVIYVPAFFIKPHYNFLYSNTDSSIYDQGYLEIYTVKDGHIVLIPGPLAPNTKVIYKNYNPPLFLYDTTTNSGHQIEWSSVLNEDVFSDLTSPDGYTIKNNGNTSGLLDPNGYVMNKNGISKKISGLNTGNFQFDNDFKFIGWIAQM